MPPYPSLRRPGTNVNFRIDSDSSGRSIMSAVHSIIGNLDTHHSQLPDIFKSQDSEDYVITAPERKVGMVTLAKTVTISVAFVVLLSCACMFAVMEVVLAKLIDARPDLIYDEGVLNIFTWAHSCGAGVLCIMVTIAVIIGHMLGTGASRPLLRADSVLFNSRRVGKNSTKLAEIRNLISQSRFREAEALYHSVFNVVSSVATFSSYLPDTVVQGIMSGSLRARRLHVMKRDVSIMFSDIEGFTTICESLSTNNLLLLLTRYLSVMTKIVETFDGVVAEILGDGLLVYWNAPDDTEMHASKACGAAVTMQQVLGTLNHEFDTLLSGLPQLKIRIGLNTGSVYCGNLGSQTKMKFGCVGDPVNLASRLESLCKSYGVGIICTDSTKRTVAHDLFEFRELDLIVAMGKQKSTRIYQLLGFSKYDDDPSVSRLSVSPTKYTLYSALVECVKVHSDYRQEFVNMLARFNVPVQVAELVLTHDYEEALHAFQAGLFVEAKNLALKILEKYPEDMATKRLLGRSEAFIGNDGSVSMSEEVRARWSGVYVMLDKFGDAAIEPAEPEHFNSKGTDKLSEVSVDPLCEETGCYV